MNQIKELYQQLILDHGRNPRNFSKDLQATHIKEGVNPLCGDKLTVYIRAPHGVVESAMFHGEGCAISMASASLMCEALKGKNLQEFDRLFDLFHQLVTSGSKEACQQLKDSKLLAMKGVFEFPMRVKCATLVWHATQAALHLSNDEVTTE
ncbi:MAG TPA: SUF system NifU family Fe-S cluster assembly protein [Gammaproteobacteria bacterium]|nr:SUF system NifU family Fe-S cluster assembly protein [Gammaproteobacteria bacterium]